MTFKKAILCLLLTALLCSVTSCGDITGADSSSRTTAIAPLPTEELIVFLHAGGGADGLTYLNSRETFEEYYSMGYRYFEYDLKLSSDGRIIATHNWEHLDVQNAECITYEDFKALRLENGYTPADEEWLIDTIKNHPDAIFIIDAKMDSTEEDIAVLTRLEELEDIYGIDISANIIPEVFSKEMWDIVKDSTTFDRYLFSHYKVYYTVDMMLEYFGDPRIWGISLPMYTDGDIQAGICRLKETKKIFFFTPQSRDEADKAAEMGADGVYLDDASLIRG